MDETLTPELARRVRALSEQAATLAVDLFGEGKRLGAAEAEKELALFVESLVDDMQEGFSAAKDPAVRADLEAMYEGASPSPLVSAHFDGAGDVLGRLRARLRKDGM